MNSRRRYSIFACFIYGLEEKNSKSEVIFAVCRLPLTSCLTSLLSGGKLAVKGPFREVNSIYKKQLSAKSLLLQLQVVMVIRIVT